MKPDRTPSPKPESYSPLSQAEAVNAMKKWVNEQARVWRRKQAPRIARRFATGGPRTIISGAERAFLLDQRHDMVATMIGLFPDQVTAALAEIIAGGNHDA